jgi:formamidopyrimidine-DNA glycosylase
MPELPEAETIVRDLRARIPGSTVTARGRARTGRAAPGLTPAALGRGCAAAHHDVSRAARTSCSSSTGGLRLVINLGMTGRVVTSDAPRAGELRHVAVASR